MPVDETVKLEPLPSVADNGNEDEALKVMAETLNLNIDRLNRLMFTFLDYAVVARKP